MKLKIDSITQSKDAREECIRLEVLLDTSLSGYALIAEISDRSNENTLLHFLKFPEWEVKKGDLIRIYSGSGEPHTLDNLIQTRTHVFYWNKESSLWGGSPGIVELVKIKDTSGKVVAGE